MFGTEDLHHVLWPHVKASIFFHLKKIVDSVFTSKISYSRLVWLKLLAGETAGALALFG